MSLFRSWRTGIVGNLGVFFDFWWSWVTSSKFQNIIQEYEVVEGEETNGEWEKELEDMLGEAPEASPEKEPEKVEKKTT